ncbi:ankyrin repeat domain-containing protein [Brachymonas wangyanguii]|uniref:ankyrin repeat domain-containing protein n=1 Tax=Brachymonas wangyanguii TaxID=3130163 RepID=UPI00307DB29D
MKKILQTIAITAISFSGIASAASIEDLMVAVKRDSDIRAREVLQQGVNPNLRGENGKTPLIHAIQEKSTKVLPVLLAARNIDVNATNANNETPLMIAIYTEQNDLARRLINRGAETDRYGWTPLHYAATKSNLDMVKLLLGRGADINADSPNNSTPLMMAAWMGNTDTIRYLIQRGALVWERNDLNMTALEFAKYGGIQANIDLIQQEQRKVRDPGKVQPLKPLTPEQAAALRGDPVAPVDAASGAASTSSTSVAAPALWQNTVR